MTVTITQGDLEGADRWKSVWGSFAERLPVEDLAYAIAHHAEQARLEERERCAKVAVAYAEIADRVVSQSKDGACKTSVMGEAVAGRAIATAIRSGEAV